MGLLIKTKTTWRSMRQAQVQVADMILKVIINIRSDQTHVIGFSVKM